MKTNADIKNAEQQEAAPKPKKRFYCPVEATLSQIGGKYKAIILYHLFEDKVLRFHELQEYMPNATAKMLTQQLRELEADGLIHREVYPVVPPKTEYSLTERGKTLKGVIYPICQWGREHMAGTF
ncbi:MAG: helix-turn-helix domain-containing protein [Eubacteriales bacterium]|jgi:DNA-binding HxlR family transcriptional regulator|nr:helix-turn-helix transcriptional regulator [Lachnospiraceae bacterium]MDD5858723.1 helix-turn-helix domain-containing protein [Eubacteriales bacterium]MCI1334807.1 helix-turn-helix transcriptional regulator [Lachnospiraceae bacterium]MCI1358911.1 helix-turn-helix transcriptional regulator [Lachnospiraceae bacterium]MCI1379535.1 helix-turn-helix transcriptional regulator [Lachnospiraceae bacterium]